MSIRPRHVLITGGSRGIGLAIAQLFAKNSYRCTLIARSEDALKHAVSTLQPLDVPPSSSTTTPQPECDLSALPWHSILSQSPSTPSTSPPTHTYIAGDMTHNQRFWSTSPGSPFGAILAPGTPIDVLVNCAGITQTSLFTRTPDHQVDEILKVNLLALMHGTQFLLRNRYLRGKAGQKKGGPVIINIASLLGVSGGYGAVAYAASKAGVLGFTRALATEYASHRVRVNAVVPGYIETDMTKELDAKALARTIPLGRFGKAEEVAAAVLFLAENEYAHNCVVNLDGGLSAV